MRTSLSINRKVLSHEIRTSLTSILSNVELLRKNTTSMAQADVCIKDIYCSGKNLLSFIATLLGEEKEKDNFLNSKGKNKKISKTEVSPLKNQVLSILLVEDEPIVQRVHVKTLEGMGCNVKLAKDGFEALKMLRDKLSYDAIFMDIGLPEMDGIETVREIRKQEQNSVIPIIGLTAYPVEEVKAQCKLAGFNNLVSKPVSQKALNAILMDIQTHGENYQVI